jgi:type VI protein secretion system component VasK
MEGLIALTIIMIIWLMPVIVASRNNHPNTVVITLLTLFLGWTFVVWAGCLVWSLVPPKINASRLRDDHRYLKSSRANRIRLDQAIRQMDKAAEVGDVEAMALAHEDYEYYKSLVG